MTIVIELAAVEWWDMPEGDDTLSYRRCDLCCTSAAEDAMDNAPFRDFWQQRGGDNDGLVIGACCIEEFLKEPLE
jgi:hypothetical protein